ncbi:MAG: lipid II flippase MurJ [Acidobacteriota bacterium]
MEIEEEATVSEPVAAFSTLPRQAAIVTFLSVAGQLVGLLTQVVIAGIFGARAEMDAFLAASTLPQYVVAVLLGALAVVFIPVFIDYDGSGRTGEAWRVASSVVTTTGLLLTALAIAGMLLAEPLIRITTPGLSPESLALAARVARIMWPGIAASGVVVLLIGVYHATGRFAWAALVPVLGAGLNLVLVLVTVRAWGVIGLAWAGVASMAFQAVLLWWGVAGQARIRPALDWRHPGVAQVVVLLWPLAVSSLLTRYTQLVDRYLASSLAEGAIAHLAYAFRLVTLVSLFLSTGIATVIFPRMALNSAVGDAAALRRTLSLGLRVMWLGVAPAIGLGVALSYPMITALIERGAFLATDTAAVSVLWRIYLVSMAAGCLGSVTGRAFYALKQTRTVAVIGVIEALAYVVYTPWLAARFGAAGVAAGYVLYLSLSVGWQLPLLRWRLGRGGGRLFCGSFARTGAAALIGGAAASAAAALVDTAWAQLVVGGCAGVLTYLGIIFIWGGPEVPWTGDVVVRMIRSLWNRDASRPDLLTSSTTAVPRGTR